jgi:hypothetical protein
MSIELRVKSRSWEERMVSETDSGGEKSKSKSKSKVDSLTLLRLLSEKVYPAEIARTMKTSKQNISNNIKRLEKTGWITGLKTWPYTCRLNSQSQEFLIYHDKEQRPTSKKPNYDLHAIQVSHIIKSRGNLPDGEVPMKNWSYWAAKFGDFSLKAHYASEDKLIIYPPHIDGDTRSEVLIRLGAKVSEIVNLVERMYKCELDRDTFHIDKRPEVHPRHDPLGLLFEKEKVDTQGKNISINQSGDGHFDINGLESFEKYDRMITIFPDFMNQVQYFARNMETHVKVLNEMSETLKMIQELTAHKIRRGHIITKRRGT